MTLTLRGAAAAVLLVVLGSLAEADDLPCVLCHPSRDRAAYEILSGMPGVDVKQESGQAFVCYSCHNGSVVDSRAVLRQGGQHPSGFAPGRPLGRGLPLYGGNRMDCGTCHSPHGKGPGARRWLRAADDGGSLCSACHSERGDRHLGVRLAAEALRAVQPLGGRAGEGGRMVCATCHRVHGARSSKLLVAPYAPGGEELCLACHPGRGGAAKPVHACATCHPVHGKGEEPLAQNARARCESCHSGRPDRHLGKPLSPEAARAVTALGAKLRPDGNIDCSTCHRVHGASGSRLLLAAYGSGKDDLCRLCHSSLTVKGGGSASGPQPCSDCHRPHANAPLQFPEDGPCRRCHGDRAGQGNHRASTSACLECHSVHHPVLTRVGRGGLLRLPLAGGALCRGCHPLVGKLHSEGAQAPAEVREGLTSRGIALGPQGQLECASCHATHGAKQKGLMRMAELPLCLFCHGPQNPYGSDGLKPGVHPVGVFLRQDQRKALDAAGGAAGPGGSLSCSSCHDAHQPSAALPGCTDCHADHAPGANHGGVAGCGACHAIHGGLSPGQACEKCHTAAAGGPHRPDTRLSGTPLPPVGPGHKRAMSGTFGCQTCHDPHGKGRHLLRRESAGATCLACHEGKSSIVGSPHDGAGKPSAGACGGCHPSHGTREGTSADATAGLCGDCHGGELKAMPAHSAAGPPAWKRGQGGLPLFDRFGRRNPYGFIACPTCHDVHAPAGRRAMRLESRNPPRLCIACHPEKSSLLGTQHDPRVKGEGETCTVCHPVHHRGNAPAFWALRSGAQGTWNDRMCSPCHGPPAGAPAPHGGPRSHPVNAGVPENMKPSGLPLFDPTGGRAGRRIACSTCHDLHGTSRDGQRTIPSFLRKEPGNGELCIACHTQEAAVIKTPHDSSEAAPTSLGPCGPCHAVHRAKADRALWGLLPAEGEYAPNTLCRSCHRQGGPVVGKHLLFQHHMKDAETFRTPRGTVYLQRPMLLLDEWAVKKGEPPLIPLYDRTGRPGPEGNLQCISCHDPHVWSPLGPFVKPGLGLLGPNVVTRFLRLGEARAAERSVCAVCHPKDAPDRYQQYHAVWEDVGGAFQ